MKYIVIFILSIIISFLLYGNTIGGDFVYDDVLFTYRRDVRSFASLAQTFFQPYLPNNPQSGVWRPIASIITGLQFIITGESPQWFHLTNILLNGLATFFVFVLVYKLFQKEKLALITAVLFAFLPIHSEAVAFIKSREDLIASVFFLGSWIMFTKKRFILSSLLYLLSVLSKETFILNPVLFLLTYQSQFKTGLYFAPTFLVYIFTRYLVLGSYAFGSDNVSFVINSLPYVGVWTRLWTAFKILFIYLKAIVFPISLSASYHYNHVTLVHNPFASWETVAGILLLVLMLSVFRSKVWRKTPIGIGVIAFLIPYLIVSKFVFTAGEFMAERWMYIPSIGIVLILAYGIDNLIKRKPVVGMLGIIIVLIWFSFIAISRNRVWISEKALYESMVQDAPQSAQAHYLLGVEYFDEHNYALAKEEADKGSSIYSEYAPLLTLQASLRIQDKQYGPAEEYLLNATRLDPTYFIAFQNLAKLYYLTDRYKNAIAVYQAMVPKSYGRLDQVDFLIYATSLTRLKQYRESIHVIKQNISGQLMPETRFLLAVNYFYLGEMNEAERFMDWDTTMTKSQKLEMIKSFQTVN